MIKITHSLDYLNSEEKRGNNVLQWAKDYCKRNKIKLEDSFYWDFDEKEIPEIELTFKSENQANYYIRKGNQAFPYFEFV